MWKRGEDNVSESADRRTVILHRQKHLTVIKTLAITCCMLFTPLLNATDLVGSWVLNDELTKEMQPKLKSTKGVGGGFSGGFIGAGGVMVPIPGSGGGSPVAAQRTLKMPVVLECNELKLDKQSIKVSISCSNQSYRDFFLDDRHGRKTNWRDRRFTESYKSTSRTVKHEFRILKGDLLKVTVSIKPRGNRSQDFVRVFERKIDTETSTDQS